MALPAFLSYLGAALGVYLVADVLVCKGWIRRGGRVHGGLMGLIVLIVQRSTVMLALWWSRDEVPTGAEAGMGTLALEAYYWRPVIPTWVICVVLCAWVEAARERRGRVPEPPPVPGRRGRAARRD